MKFMSKLVGTHLLLLSAAFTFSQGNNVPKLAPIIMGDGLITFVPINSSKGSSRDVLAPVISLNGEEIVYSVLGVEYEDAGATAMDNIDGSVKVTTSGSVDTNKVGKYTLTYTATDKAGNKATKSRTVIVDNKISVIDFGAECDGISDDTLAFQKGIDSTSKNHKILVVPNGCTLKLTDEHIIKDSVPDESNFKYRHEHRSIQLRDNTSILIEEGAKVMTNSRITGMYVENINININGELIQYEYPRFKLDDGSISQNYWALRGYSAQKWYNPLSTEYKRYGETYNGMKAYNCVNENTSTLRCSYAKGTYAFINFSRSDRGVIEILGDAASDKFNGSYKIYSSKKSGKIIGPWKIEQLNYFAQKKYGKNYDELSWAKKHYVNVACWEDSYRGVSNKGIALLAIKNAEVHDLDVSGFGGETVYASNPLEEVRFYNNTVHDGNANGLNFNSGRICEGNCSIDHNKIYNILQAVEASTGSVTYNKISNVGKAFLTGYGSGAGVIVFSNNEINNTREPALAIIFSSVNKAPTSVSVEHNNVINANWYPLEMKNVRNMLVKNNQFQSDTQPIVFDKNVSGEFKGNTVIRGNGKMPISINEELKPNGDYIIDTFPK